MGLDNPIHIAFLLILLLLVFGAKRLPEMGRSLGSGMRGFKDSLSGETPQSSAVAQQLVPAAQATTSPAVAPIVQPVVQPVAQSVADDSGAPLAAA
jgi:sec-independent protein translocase protein TatA